MTKANCESCGSEYLLRPCVVARNPPIPGRDRIEAILCYSCRRKHNHEVLDKTYR